MISAPNRQQRLSGNNINLMLIIFLFVHGLPISSCTKKVYVQDKANVQIVEADQETTPINANSSTHKNERNEPQVITKVDTVKWTQDETQTPIIDKISKKVIKKQVNNFKHIYNVKVLIPLNSYQSDESLISSSRFVQFYAGMLRAFEKLDDEQIHLNVQIIDTEDNSSTIVSRIDKIVTEDTDLIIGPFDKDDVKAYAEACKEAYVPLISPWQTSSKTTSENPYYIQMKPNLREHFSKLALSTSTEFKNGEVAIIVKSNKEGNAWISYFQETVEQVTGRKNFFVTQTVSEEILANGVFSFGSLLSSGIKAFIIPNYSFSDESFVYNALRRLNAEKGTRRVVVYGMPLMYESDKIDFEYYNALNMRIVMSDFVDEKADDIRNFRREYFDQYGEIATVDAVKGYDLMLYLGRNLWKYGKEFQFRLDEEPATYLMSTYNIQKSKADDSPSFSDPTQFDFFENKHLDIIEFKGTRFEIRKD